MKFHIQTKFGGHVGNCYPTAIACLIDKELDEVPSFELLYFEDPAKRELFLKRAASRAKSDDDNWLARNLWFSALHHWLLYEGYELWDLKPEAIDEWLQRNPGVPYLAYGPAARGLIHVCIYQDGQILHDPHPDNSGLISVQGYEILVPIRD